MRPTPRHRIAAALVAAFFLLGGAEHWYGIDPCPHHEAAVVGSEGGAPASGHHAHHTGSSDASESDAEEHGPCSCVGPCAATPPATLAATASNTIEVAVERIELAPVPPREIVAPQFIPFLLPYAHAPPSHG